MKTLSIREIKAQAVRNGLIKETENQVVEFNGAFQSQDFGRALSVSKTITTLLGEILKHSKRSRKRQTDETDE